MKYEIIVKRINNSAQWTEKYDETHVTNDAQAELQGRTYVEFFNSTLRPHEVRREFVSAKVVGKGTGAAHHWQKQNLVTLIDPRWGMYDKVKCRHCEVTARRYGLGERRVKLSAEFKAKKYMFCNA